LYVFKGPKNLFDLDDFSNYMISTVLDRMLTNMWKVYFYSKKEEENLVR